MPGGVSAYGILSVPIMESRRLMGCQFFEQNELLLSPVQIMLFFEMYPQVLPEI